MDASRDPMLFHLARNLCVGFIANQMGVTIRTADAYVDKDPEMIGELWWKLARIALEMYSSVPAPWNMSGVKNRSVTRIQ